MSFVDDTNLLENAAKRQRDRDAGQVSMFDMFGEDEESGFEEEVPPPDGIEWDKRTKLAFEKEIMKIYVSEHPLQPYERMLARMSKFTMGELSERTKEIRNGDFVGMVSGVTTKLTKTGNRMATFTLEDTSGSMECICFKYSDFADAIVEDAVVKIKGKFECGDRGSQIIAYEVETIELGDEQAKPLHMQISVYSNEYNLDVSMKLTALLKQFPGSDGVSLLYTQGDGRRFRAELPVHVDATSRVLALELSRLFGRDVLHG